MMIPWSLATLRLFLRPYGYTSRAPTAQELPGGADHLNHPADAASYILRAIELDPAARRVAEGHSYATFQALQRSDAWRAALQPI